MFEENPTQSPGKTGVFEVFVPGSAFLQGNSPKYHRKFAERAHLEKYCPCEKVPKVPKIKSGLKLVK